MPKFLSSRLMAMTALTISLAACQSAPTSTASVQSLPKTDAQTSSKTNTQADDLALDLTLRHEYQLDNGLKLIIKEDHRSPVVMTQIWYRVGSADEPVNKGGISHLLEHMMFKGTKTVSSADFERLIAKFGGVNNAFTSYDYTGYYELFPANRLGLALELEADRMTQLIFDEAEFKKEHQVVMEERRQRTDDNPLAKAYEEFRLKALPNSPKGESVIGPMNELESITLNELKNWYKSWYAPNNATVVIVGDVTPKAALAEVKRYFADIPKQTLPKRPSVLQRGYRSYQQLESKQAVEVPVLLMGFNVPSFITASNKPEALALSLAQDVLDGGLSARLEQRLVRDQGLLTSIGTSYDVFDRGDGLFLIQATPREGISLRQAQTAIMAEINKLISEPIRPDEISRAKTNTLTSLIYAQDSVEGQAQMIGSLQSIGLDDTIVARLPSLLDPITTADIQKAAQNYLVKNNLTVMDIVPMNSASVITEATKP
ncbi:MULTISPECIES: pitrilysin family protein [Psychrobacter]|uniref:M16 family metallopeptidase n=1 Tax=Psychrobacter TaxID=497 RepID=UPI001469CA3D|nr:MULTISPECIES: pitrilysin family protein [Psychrobacter]